MDRSGRRAAEQTAPDGHSTLGKLVGLVRKRHGWTLREMSEKVGIPLSTLAKVESDKLALTYDKLQQFTSRLGMTMAEFLSVADAPRQIGRAHV